MEHAQRRRARHDTLLRWNELQKIAMNVQKSPVIQQELLAVALALILQQLNRTMIIGLSY